MRYYVVMDTTGSTTSETECRGFVNVSIHAHPTKKHLANGWWVCCYASLKDLSRETARGSHEFRPIEKVKSAARRKARHLFRKMNGRNPEEKELRWTFLYLSFLPDQLKKNAKLRSSVPEIVYVGRLSGPAVNGPFKLKFNRALSQWFAVTDEGKKYRESVVGLGEMVHHGATCARFASPNKEEVEQWLRGVRAALAARPRLRG